jgi:hypothetical protein
MKTAKLFCRLTLGLVLCAGISRGYAQGTAPVITSEPSSQTAATGDNVTFSVTASGSEPLAYQWFYNSSVVADATNSSITISNVQSSNAGEYAVIVTNDFGSVTSVVATLTVSNAPTAQTFLDFNGDGNADLLWLHPNGTLVAWLMDGTNVLSSITLPYKVPPGWNMAGQADFNDDGKLDFVFQHLNGKVAVWFMDGTNQLDSIMLVQKPMPGWRIVGIHDFDKDGNADLLWQHGNGRVAVWFMDGTTVDRFEMLNNGQRVQGGWKIVALADMDEDGEMDILWQHGGGRVGVWYMNGTDILRFEIFRFSQHTSSSWQITGFADMNGDGQNDLLWQNSSGYTAVWLLNGTLTPTSGLLRYRVTPGWSIVNH